MTVLRGKGVSGGIAFGSLYYVSRADETAEKKTDADKISDIKAEIERFEKAKAKAAVELDALAKSAAEKLGEENAVLFETHRMMLEDEDFCEAVTEFITEEKLYAECAVEKAGENFARDFAESGDDYLKERAADVRDVARRVRGILTGAKGNFTLPDIPVILASDDFSPGETAQIDKSKVPALASRAGAANSHTAIFARTMGIPAVIGLGASLSPGLSGKRAIIDGDEGTLYVEPDAETLNKMTEKSKNAETENLALEKFRGKITVTKSGKRVKLYANIGSVADAEAALANDAEGIGLFRSEFLYLGRDDYPDEEYQFENYKKVIERMDGRQVIIRTLDIGADKQVDYFSLPREENPALGLRAIRICLTRPELLKTQLRAIYRASAFGSAAIMFPMICSTGELRRAKAYAASVREELAREGKAFDGKVPIGIMIETPASVIISDMLAPEADFFSIGTNDLTQYTLAVDRQNEALREFSDPRHEAILRMIKMTADSAHEAGIWCGICGTLAADPELTDTFVKDGIDELSVEPPQILKLRARIMQNH